ncbi:MAG: aminoglycoside phosphotransferase family protein [Bacteroidales bacterium]|nr:aminoglycoside phosphotransferase family protein [Bacteroidales bacterium]
MEQNYLKNVATQFAIESQPFNVELHGNGHINKTFKVDTIKESFLLQQINSEIFDIEKLDHNSRLVTWHIFEYRKEYEQSIDNDIWFIPLRDKEDHLFLKDSQNAYWRMMNFIPNSHAYEVVPDENVAYEGGRKFGEFIKILTGEDVFDYQFPVENFHDIEQRLRQFQQAIHRADQQRKKTAEPEIRFVSDHIDIKDPIAKLLRRKQIPLSVVHNDAKINNVLFNKHNNKALSVIDLDTVMPGSILFDFGDMIRTFSSPVKEDETDTSEIHMRKDIVKALTEGFMSEAGPLLTLKERQLLLISGKFMTFMIGVRFLTDYLNGDVYYKTNHPDHNLIRCRNQFKLLQSIIEQEDDVKIP